MAVQRSTDMLVEPNAKGTKTHKIFEQFYLILIGVAVALAADRVLGKSSSAPTSAPEGLAKYLPPADRWPAIALFVAFVVTAVPFVHGTVRSLEKTYRDLRQPARRLLMFVEYATALVQSAIFFAMAASEGDIRAFCSCMMWLFGIHAIWGVVFSFIHGVVSRPETLWWGVINLTAALLMLPLISYDDEFTWEVSGNNSFLGDFELANA